MQQRLSAIPDSAHLDSALSGTARLTQRVSFFSPLPELFTEKPRTNLILDFLEIQRSTGADFKNLVLNLLHSEIYAVQCTVYTGRYQLDSALSQTLLSLNLSIYSVFLANQIGPQAKQFGSGWLQISSSSKCLRLNDSALSGMTWVTEQLSYLYETAKARSVD